MADIHVDGLVQLNDLLKTLPDKLRRNVLRAALRQGALIVQANAKAKAPVGEPSEEGRRLYGHYRGALRDSIRTTTKLHANSVSASVKAGGKSRKTGADVHYAHIVEFTGAKAHLITTRDAKGLTIGNRGEWVKYVHHPGMQAKAFMRPALDEGASAAVTRVGEYLKRRLARKPLNLDTADIVIEERE